MAENKMQQVAELLGVEMYKTFKIKNYIDKFSITDEGLYNLTSERYNFYVLFNLLKGIDEIEKPILTEKEKCYLENVLKPFKDKVEFIRKDFHYSKNQEHIHIGIKNDFDIDFPNFQQGTMYKGMESDRRYTLEELGLFEEE